jgi:protein SCO1/2
MRGPRVVSALPPAALLVALLASVAVHADPVVDEHAHHRQMLAAPAINVLTDREYAIPDLRLQNERGDTVALRELLDGDRGLAVNFIFTTCTTICPVMTATLLQLQRELAGRPDAPRYVSISIDPDYDSAQVLHAYAERFGANWTFLTGSRDDVIEVLQAFNAYRGNKNNHAPVTLFRRPAADRWIRVEGLASAGELARIWSDGAP